MGILDTAVTGLLVSQRALATTSHNISNVNTPGYSRQRVEVIAKPATVYRRRLHRSWHNNYIR